jgi:hypothetical protein
MHPRNAYGFSILLLIVLLFTVAILGAGGWIGWRIYSQSTQPRTSLVGAKVKPDLLAFAYGQLPTTYIQIAALDDAIAMIRGEIDRLAGIAKQYPAQKTLLDEEIKKLERIKTEFGEALSATLAGTETLFVTYLMDTTKGLRAIKKQRTILRRQAKATLHRHAALRQRLGRNQSQGLVDKLLALVGK